MGVLVIRGATLAGMAAAARLARLGHAVTLVTDGAQLGTLWVGGSGPGGHTADALPPVITLPAAWRDLFKKSGAHLVTALNGSGLKLIEAPPVEHHFADGSVLHLPTGRGEQVRAIEALCGHPAAIRWQRLLDDLDAVWAALRHFAVDSTALPRNRTDRQRLWLNRTVDEVAEQLADKRLEALIRSKAQSSGTSSGGAPALVLSQLVVERVFGRWLLSDAAGQAQPASRLIELLAQRLAELRVCVSENSPGSADLDCRPHRRRKLTRAAPTPIRPPRITHELLETKATNPFREIHEHGEALTIEWQRRLPGATLLTRQDYSKLGEPDPGYGLAPSSAKAWLRRTPIFGDGPPRASACSPAGAEPWAELSSAALAVYALHESLTGQDARPTNRNFRPPRLKALPDGLPGGPISGPMEANPPAAGRE